MPDLMQMTMREKLDMAHQLEQANQDKRAMEQTIRELTHQLEQTKRERDDLKNTTRELTSKWQQTHLGGTSSLQEESSSPSTGREGINYHAEQKRPDHGEKLRSQLIDDIWLGRYSGKEWLKSDGGKNWLKSDGGKKWLTSSSGRKWLASPSGYKWLGSSSGRKWLGSSSGYEWLDSFNGYKCYLRDCLLV